MFRLNVLFFIIVFEPSGGVTTSKAVLDSLPSVDGCKSLKKKVRTCSRLSHLFEDFQSLQLHCCLHVCVKTTASDASWQVSVLLRGGFFPTTFQSRFWLFCCRLRLVKSEFVLPVAALLLPVVHLHTKAKLLMTDGQNDAAKQRSSASFEAWLVTAAAVLRTQTVIAVADVSFSALWLSLHGKKKKAGATRPLCSWSFSLHSWFSGRTTETEETWSG